LLPFGPRAAIATFAAMTATAAAPASAAMTAALAIAARIAAPVLPAAFAGAALTAVAALAAATAAAVLASLAVATRLAFAGGGCGFGGFAAAEDSLQPADKTAGLFGRLRFEAGRTLLIRLLRARLGTPIIAPRLARIEIAIVATLARRARLAGVSRVACFARVTRLEGPRFARLARFATFPRLEGRPFVTARAGFVGGRRIAGRRFPAQGRALCGLGREDVELRLLDRRGGRRQRLRLRRDSGGCAGIGTNGGIERRRRFGDR